MAASTTNTEFSKKTTPSDDLIHLQTLYHADKKKADSYILELMTWLHQLIIAVKQKEYGFRSAPLRSPSHRGKMLHPIMRKPSSVHAGRETNKVVLSEEQQNLLERVTKRGQTPGISESQEFVRSHWRDTERCVSSRSMGKEAKKMEQSRPSSEWKEGTAGMLAESFTGDSIVERQHLSGGAQSLALVEAFDDSALFMGNLAGSTVSGVRGFDAEAGSMFTRQLEVLRGVQSVPAQCCVDGRGCSGFRPSDKRMENPNYEKP
ncbi:hypothetical protein Ancab_028667 [Ancistrocladus abbreviatus]